MPNGGVPRHMVMYPGDGTETAVYCEGGLVRIYGKGDWRAQHRNAEPWLTISEDEARALAWFLRYWLGEHSLKPAYDMPRGAVNAEFDF